ncbi:MAG: hypothetical protein B6I31_02475 [Desulfobacteraceae bacterium 4572_19]|nr:MAG: hypothetical protein B6I31_02475 [Desulfobacteraceae bacterium 4572_19]
MNRWIIISLIILFCTSFVACGTVQKKHGSNGSPDKREPEILDIREVLKKVVAEEIIPQLKQKSFIKNPVFIMAGKVDGVVKSVGKIDDISKQVRKLITLNLLKETGYPIVQRHRLSNLELRGRRHRLDCDKFQLPQYYLIIDTQLLGNHIYIDLIGKDIEEGNTAVPGSVISITPLKAEPNMVAMLEHLKWDEFLEGTVRLPVSAGDKDAVAAYIGYNLICLLQDIYYDHKGAYFYIDTSKLVKLYDKSIAQDYLVYYLSSYQLPLVDNPAKATHIIQISAGQSKNLATMWANIRENQSGKKFTLGAEKVYYLVNDKQKKNKNKLQPVPPVKSGVKSDIMPDAKSDVRSDIKSDVKIVNTTSGTLPVKNSIVVDENKIKTKYKLDGVLKKRSSLKVIDKSNLKNVSLPKNKMPVKNIPKKIIPVKVTPKKPDSKIIKSDKIIIYDKVVIISDDINNSSKAIQSSLSQTMLKAGYSPIILQSGSNYNTIQKEIGTGNTYEIFKVMQKLKCKLLFYINSSVEVLSKDDYITQFYGKGRARLFQILKNQKMQMVIDVTKASKKIFASSGGINPQNEVLMMAEYDVSSPNSFQKKVIEPLMQAIMFNFKRLVIRKDG